VTRGSPPRRCGSFATFGGHCPTSPRKTFRAWSATSPAHRLAQGARSLFAWQADAVRRLAESFADYVTEENRLVVGRAEHDGFAAGVASLRDALERLEKRIGRLG
jgi:ubiquinone biosynthesis accessory factor UbiJ